MEVPNLLFYENRIMSGYCPNPDKRFMFSDRPFLFIDVPNGVEKLKGTSFYNMQEVDVIVGLKDYCLQIFAETRAQHKQNPEIDIMKFNKNSIYVITPYNAQKNAIAEYFSDSDTDDQVLSIDSSQGREFDLVFVSMVRTKAGTFVKEQNRINVGITRAKHGLVIVGNAAALSKEPNWERLLTEKASNVVTGLNGAKKWIKTELAKAVAPAARRAAKH